MSNEFDFWDSVYEASNEINETTEAPDAVGPRQQREWPKQWTGNAVINKVEYAESEGRDGSVSPTCEFEMQVSEGDDMAKFRIWKKFYLNKPAQLAHMRQEIGKLGQSALPTNAVEAETMVNELVGCEIELYRKCRLPDYKQPNVYFNRMVSQKAQQSAVDEIPF